MFQVRDLYGKFYFRLETVWKTDSGKYISVWNDCMVAEGQVVVETIKPYGSCPRNVVVENLFLGGIVGRK